MYRRCTTWEPQVLTLDLVSLCAYPFELVVWLDVVGVKVLVETIVFEKFGPVSSVWIVLGKDDSGVFISWQQLVDIVKMTQLGVLSDFGITTQNPMNVFV